MRVRPAILLGISLWLSKAALADLEKARRLLDQWSFSAAAREARASRSQDTRRAELLEIWALSGSLHDDEAWRRLEAFRPDQGCLSLYLLVKAQLTADSPSRIKCLQQALELCERPEGRVDLLLHLFEATPAPADLTYWQQAAEIAGKTRLSSSLLGRLSLAHLNIVRSSRPAEAWADLAVAQQLLRDDPSGEARCQQARADLLEASGQPEAVQARWQAVLAQPDPAVQARTLLNYLRSGKGTERRPEIARLQQRLEGGARDPALKLCLFLCRSTARLQLDRSAWLRQLEIPCRSSDADLRMLALAERSRARLLEKQAELSLADAQAALELSLSHPHRAQSPLFRSVQPATLHQQMAKIRQGRSEFAESEKHFVQMLESGQDDPHVSGEARLSLMLLYLQTGQVQKAREDIQALFRLAESQPSPRFRSVTYSQVFNYLLVAALQPNQLFDMGPNYRPIRMDPDTTSGWVFEEIRDNPELLSQVWAALDSWRQVAIGPDGRGTEAVFRGMILACLERPLEAIDSYTQALKLAEGATDLRANIAWILSCELWAQGRRQEALDSMRLSYQEASRSQNNPGLPTYRLQLAAELIECGQTPEALAVLEEGLKSPDGAVRPLYLLLRGKAQRDVHDLKEALRICRYAPHRAEILFALQKLEPKVDWLGQIKAEDVRTSLRLANYYQEQDRPDKVVEVGKDGLERFQQTFEQLPSSARPQSLRSPSLKALLEATVSAHVKQGQNHQGAEWLSWWRAVQNQPALVSPELEVLRAELTGLKAAGNEKRLADTRAQFLVKLGELRQRNPEMESTVSAQGNELLALQPHLDEQTLLVQYYLAADGLYLQWVTRQQQSLTSVRVEKARLLELVADWKGALAQPRPLSESDLQSSRQLYSLLVAPLRELRQQHPNLWVMPSGELWGLPWETLQDENGHYLVESSACAYLGPSEAVALVSDPPAVSGHWVGLGNPRLPGTTAELASLRSLFQDGQVVNGWSDLQAAAAQARFLHLATHSVARPDRPLQSFLELADGPLALEKIYALALPPGSLVVLSSCSGAVAQKHRERDLISLSSGFRAAGAASVIAALWPVDDEATAVFFIPMYQSLLAGSSRQVALQQAKRAMLARSEMAHPFYWGAFTLLGDPR